MKNCFFAMMLCASCFISCNEGTDVPWNNGVGVIKEDSDKNEQGQVGSDDELKATLSYITHNSAIVTVELGDTTDIKSKGYLYSVNENTPVGQREVYRNTVSLKKYMGIILDLKPSTQYFVRPYKIIGNDSIYGQTVSFTTLKNKSEVRLQGNVTWKFDPAVDIESIEDADLKNKYKLIETAMDSATYYYNLYTTCRKDIKVEYQRDVPTANGSSSGKINFGGEGKNTYLCVGTAMHETAHTIGVGTTNKWKTIFTDNGVGPVRTANVINTYNMLRTEDDAKLVNADSKHFWPYGLGNTAKEMRDFVMHALLLNAMVQDGLQN